MIRNHFHLFLRSVRRHRSYAFINISGLAVGLAACFLIFLFIRHELSFERMTPDAGSIFRVLTIDKALGTNNQRVGITMPAFGPAVSGAFPEVTDGLRVSGAQRTLLRHESAEPIYAEELRVADANFFDFFDFRLIRGDEETALTESNYLILTQSLARRIFGEGDPMGEVLTNGNGQDLTVTGILEDLPSNTHFQFDALMSMRTMEMQARANQSPGSSNPIWLERWNMIAMPTYVKLAPGTSTEGLDARLTAYVRENGVSENFDITLQALTDVHLGSTDIIFDAVQNKGDRGTVTIFAAIALLTLVIAIVNYMNLATARSADRAREVGMRKVVGSTRGQLVRQFLSESVLTVCMAMIIAGLITWLALPLVQNLTGVDLAPDLFSGLQLVGISVVLTAFIGLLAGVYPAAVLASFRPISVLKGTFRSSKQGRSIRVGLVVFQFTLSIALIGSTAIVQQQLRYIQSKDLGYDREQVVLFDVIDGRMAQDQQSFRQALLESSAFESVAISNDVPGRTFGRTRVRPEGASDEEIWIWSNFAASPDVLPTLGMETVQGRNFDRDRPADEEGVVLINQTAVRMLGWDNPLERRLHFGAEDSVGASVIGVVEDFHFAGLKQNIEPLVIFPLTNPGNTIAARIAGGSASQALAHAEQAWQSMYPDYPFEFTFMDEEFDELYAGDKLTAKVVNIFSMLAILIACLGLFGLASYSISQRTREIGVRKAVGATTSGIARLLVLDLVRWVALANVIAWPLCWYVSSRWLDGFAYRVDPDPVQLLVATGIALAVSVVTVLGQSWRAARLNPAVALRQE